MYQKQPAFSQAVPFRKKGRTYIYPNHNNDRWDTLSFSSYNHSGKIHYVYFCIANLYYNYTTLLEENQ